MSIRAVIFDLDGTLLDSLGDITESMNLMLEHRGYPRCSGEDFRAMVGDGMERLVERALPPEARTEEMIRQCTVEYRNHYEQQWKVKTVAYPGINELLDTLAQRGMKTGVISNKAHRFTVPMCDHFFGSGRFSGVLGQRDSVPRKPAPDAGLAMAESLGLPPEHCAYVGDSGVDIEFALNCRMRPIGVLWGFRSETELRAAGAQILVNRAEEILNALG